MSTVSIMTRKNTLRLPATAEITEWDFSEGPDFPGGKAIVTLKIDATREITLNLNGKDFTTLKSVLVESDE